MRTGQSSASSGFSNDGRAYRWHPRAKQPARQGWHFLCRSCRYTRSCAPSPGVAAPATNPGSLRRSVARLHPYRHQFFPVKMGHAGHAEHMVTCEPPAADIEEHWRDGNWNVQVVVDPEEFAFALFPLNGKLFIAIKSTESLSVGRSHGTSSLK